MSDKNSKIELFSIISIGLLIVIFRIWILEIFGFVYTDSDQSVMWLGATHFSQGLFYEPRFYGQEYNTMLEALFSVPLVKLGVPIHKALPIITTLFTLFPVFLLATITYLRSSKITGVIILCVFLMLPLEYSLITSLSRGFVVGIAVASLSFLFLYKNHSNTSFLFVFFISVIAYSISANSVIISLPICLLFILKNYKNTYFYFFSGIGFVLGILIHLFIATFYVDNECCHLHSYQMKFSFEFLKNGLLDLDKFFNNITPIFWSNGWIILPVFFLLAYLLYKQKKYLVSLVSITLPIILLGTLFFSKVHDGTTSIFFSYSRMYLAVPIVLLLLISFIKIKQKSWMYFSIIGALFSSSLNIFTPIQIIEKNLKKEIPVMAEENKKVFQECAELNTYSKQNNVELIIIVNHWYNDIYNYACPSCLEDFPKTLRPKYERRIWRLLEDEFKVYSTILIVDLENNLSEQSESISVLNEKQGFYLLENNTLITINLLEKLNIKVRKFK